MNSLLRPVAERPFFTHRLAVALLFMVLEILSPGGSSRAGDDGLILVTTPRGDKIYAELADTPQKRSRGLMFRESLPGDRGMLFAFGEAQAWTFWMKNTKIPLDIIWMDQDKRIIHVERNVPTCARTDDGCPQYQPNGNALYVLELSAGATERLKLDRSVKLQFQVPDPRLLPSR